MDSETFSVFELDDFPASETDSEFLSTAESDADMEICLSELVLLSELEIVPMSQPQSRLYNIQIQKIDCTDFFKTYPPA